MIETSPTAPAAPPPPAPLRGWRSGVRIIVGVTVTLTLVLVGLFGVLAIMRYSAFSVQYPARLTAPDRIGALIRSPAAEPQPAERELLADDSAFSAVYTSPGKRLFVTGRAERIVVPDRALPALPGRAPYEVDPGPIGGNVRCVIAEPTVVVCGWSDHGSSGLLRFAGWQPVEVPQLVTDVRGATIVRG